MPGFLGFFNRLLTALEVPGLEIPAVGVRFFREDAPIPPEVRSSAPRDLTLTSCQAVRQAELGDPVLLTLENIGCVAAAVSLGLVDQNQAHPLQGPRLYTEIMHQQAPQGSEFLPPTPKDFTDGIVYACQSSGRRDFCLFGERDSGRFKDQATARSAVADMMAIQPPVMAGVFLYPPDFTEPALEPDVVVLSVRPVELTRIIQAYQYRTGLRLEASMGGLRAVNSDLIVRPYLTQRMNISPYCLGARLIAKFDANRLGIGIPYSVFTALVEGMEESLGGYPFSAYPGASDKNDG